MIDRVKFQITNPEHTIEELILAGMITHTDFLKRIASRVNLDYFRSLEIRILISWILEYLETQGEAPGKKMEVICRVETQKDEALQKQKLESLINIALTQFGDSFNTEYVLPKALRYFRKQSLTLSMELTRHFLDKDDLEEAELSYYKYKEVAEEISYTPNPFSDEAIQNWWEYTEEELMRFPGYLGTYLSPICRGQLIGVMGPPKRGKTTLLTEFACIALMHKLKVAFFSLEMNLNKINQRIMTRLAGKPKIPEKYQDFVIPVMDCLKNQTGECRSVHRASKINLLGDDGKVRAYDPRLDGRYLPCTYCLETGKGLNTRLLENDYAFAVWYQTKRYPHTTIKDFKTVRDDFQQIFGGNNLVVEAYPVGTFSCKDLKNRLTLLEQEKKLLFDVICIPEGSLVLTQDRGLVPIEKIEKSDKVWDGRAWVGHEGVIYKGVREVIEYAGITATPNHLFWTEGGWRSLELCRKLGLRIAQTEHNGKNLRIGENYIPNSESSDKKKNKEGWKAVWLLCPHRVYSMWKRKNDSKRDSRQMGPLPKQLSRVWDIRNAGPFHSFTVQGVLAHNCVDYACIMKKEDRREHRLEIGSIWEQLTALSQERNCLVVTASQTNRAATSKADLSMEDLAEDYSKAMIADMFLAINQTSQEKDAQILRIATILHRHRGFSLHHQCRVIQAPSIGQFCLGSCGITRKLSR
ncbi:MAG: hypothetical protein EHM49_00500 [Deltaproteobacteria bacterium]|nr:MAG: hypothetical protein EHM49_00500 [Deltaproteobacteria bacterium]